MPRVHQIWRNVRLATLSEMLPGMGTVDHGLLAARDGRIIYAGPEADDPTLDAKDTIDCDSRWIAPGLVDYYTHLVYGGTR